MKTIIKKTTGLVLFIFTFIIIVDVSANNEYLIYEKGTMQFSSIAYKEDYRIIFKGAIYGIKLLGPAIPAYTSDIVLNNSCRYLALLQ